MVSLGDSQISFTDNFNYNTIHLPLLNNEDINNPNKIPYTTLSNMSSTWTLLQYNKHR